MLKRHFDLQENHLLSISRIPETSGHPLHKGSPRETFIKEFLIKHLSEKVTVGTGEIIDANSKPGDSRNQIDIVVYRPEYPKLDFGGGINGFLAESVVATIEVKSTLDEEGIKQSIRAAKNIKGLKRGIIEVFSAGYQPPSILSYVVAYDGPAKMETVHGWIQKSSLSEGIIYPITSLSDEARTKVVSPCLDAVFVLGKGFIYFDNVPAGFIDQDTRKQYPKAHWCITNSTHGSLLLLFLFLTTAISGLSGSWLDPSPYLKDFTVADTLLLD